MNSFSKFISTICNNLTRKKFFFYFPFRKKILNLLKILRNEGLVSSFSYGFISTKQFFKINLRNVSSEKLRILLLLLSSPSNLKFLSKKDLQKVSNKLGVIILSTSKGILTNKMATFYNIGGIALIYAC